MLPAQLVLYYHILQKSQEKSSNFSPTAIIHLPDPPPHQHLCDTTSDEELKAKLELEIKELDDKANALMTGNARKPQDQKTYQEKYDELSTKFEKTKEELGRVLSNIEEKKSKSIQIDNYISILKDLKVAKWDRALWVALVDKMIVGKYKTEIVFKDGVRV